MAHPYAGHREMHVGHRRAKTLMKSGGYVHSDAAADKKLFKKAMTEHEGTEGEKHEGMLAGGRLDKHAKGGKVQKVMHEFKAGELHSGSKSGPKVSNRKQAVAIALSEARKAGESVPAAKALGGSVRKITPSKRKPHMKVNIVNISRESGPPPPSAGLAGPALGGTTPAGGLPLRPPGMKRGGVVKKAYGGGLLGPIVRKVTETSLRKPRPPGFPSQDPTSTAVAAAMPTFPKRAGMGMMGAGAGGGGYAAGGRARMRKGKDYGQGSGEGRLEEFKHMKGGK